MSRDVNNETSVREQAEAIRASLHGEETAETMAEAEMVDTAETTETGATVRKAEKAGTAHAAGEAEAVAVPPTPRPGRENDFGLRRLMLAGLAVMGLLVLAGAGWAASSELAGAVIARGKVVVDGNVKKIQHRTGGIVAEIRVRNGDRVEAGDVLLRLDDTQIRAELGVLKAQRAELLGRRARLTAERDGLEEIVFPKELLGEDAEAKAIRAGERRLFEAGRKALAGQRAQLRERIAQLRQEIEGLIAQRDAKAHELVLVKKELARVQAMYERKLIPVTRLLSMQREQIRVQGEHGALVAQISRTRGRISETELQILAIDQTTRKEAQTTLREIEGKLAELAERLTAAEDRLRRVDLRAPMTGIVHELTVHTVGGVISPAEPVMLIVPDREALAIETRVSPADIDQLHIGQKAMLRFSAFNQRTTPELEGRVTRISADITRDEKTGEPHYVVRIGVAPGEWKRLGKGRKPVPGMPVEAFIQTAARSVLSYLVKPVTDQLSRAFREE